MILIKFCGSKFNR